jgi:SAM-dependent methyltransferase
MSADLLHADGMERFDQKFWDERYSSAPALWSGEPNHHLVLEVKDLKPGTALDVGCGEGADSIWLAQSGWEVTGLEISEVALDRARRAATEKLGDSRNIDFRHVNILEWSPNGETFDLVSAHFFHTPPAIRPRIWQMLISAVSPGGTLLIVAHDPDDPHVKEHRAHEPELFYKGSEIAEAIPEVGWTIVKNAVASRVRPDSGEQFLDMVFRARRDS